MATTCAACGATGTGKFCANCGASLEGRGRCRSCSNPLPPGARFCNMCGTPVAAAAATGAAQSAAPSVGPSAESHLPWVVAGVAVLLLAAVLILPRLGGGSDSPAAGPVPGTAAGSPSSIDLESMNPREAADRLFTRVMTNVSGGDSASARAFAPMAIAAYERAEPLDVDGRYHLAALHIVAGDAEGAAREAAAILEEVPTHLFGFYTSAQAAAMLGNPEQAREHFRGFLANYDAELAASREEYVAHAAILPEMRRDAVNATQN